MKLLFIGFAVDRKMEDKLTGISVAGNKMQYNLLKKIRCLTDIFKVVSIYPCAAYPNGEKLIINKHDEIVVNDNNCLYTTVPFMINLPIIKNLFEIYSTYYVAKKIVKRHEIKKILVYNAFPSVSYTAKKLQRECGCEVTCLLADLPIDDSVKTKGIRKYLLTKLENYTRRAIPQMDKIVTLNEKAAKLYAPNVPYIVMEGAVDVESVPPFHYINPKQKNVVFTGSLQKHNGIVEVVEAFKKLQDYDVELNIYGKGEFRDYVIETSKRYPNIKYCGTRSNDDILEIQREAYLLINPRPVDNYISQVTFPSKIFEYMVSGTPVLTTKLNGFHEEYFDTMYFIENNDVDSIIEGMKYVLNQTPQQMKDIARKAYTMVKTKKNWDIQTSRIFDFINE